MLSTKSWVTVNYGVRSTSPLLFEVGIPNLVYGGIWMVIC